jgi:hypothetical protein
LPERLLASHPETLALVSRGLEAVAGILLVLAAVWTVLG